MENTNIIRGFKVFTSDWTCLGKKYTCPGVFEEEIDPSICDRGMHFCKQAKDCFAYYSFDPNNKVAEVVALGEVVEKGDKCCTNKLQIIREIPWEEVLTIVNSGKNCTGFNNTGDYNSGDYNSGNCNSGDHNSGNCNSGDYNSGYYNSGDYNTGYHNSGNHNSGDCNSGNYNSGNYNSGNHNSGYYNSGNYNSGNRNSGYYNSGDYNSGEYNSGNYNTGDFNIVNNENGCFCTEQHNIRIFDKETNMTFNEWRNSEAYGILCKIDLSPTEWIHSCDMSDAEKAEHPGYKTTGGYLKKNDTSKAFIAWWEKLTDNEKDIIKSIPNFNAEKFFLITGIKV